jgi:hypothetical protein
VLQPVCGGAGQAGGGEVRHALIDSAWGRSSCADADPDVMNLVDVHGVGLGVAGGVVGAGDQGVVARSRCVPVCAERLPGAAGGTGVEASMDHAARIRDRRVSDPTHCGCKSAHDRFSRTSPAGGTRLAPVELEAGDSLN